MGRLLACYLMPHPPIIIPEVGRGEQRKIDATAQSMEKCWEEIHKHQPDTILLITPHGIIFRDALAISFDAELQGDLGRFGAMDVSIKMDNDIVLCREIASRGENHDLSVAAVDKSMARGYNVTAELDHGALIPLYFGREYINKYKLVHMSMALLPYERLYILGSIIGGVIRDGGDKNVVIIASGDLSHRLIPGAPAGYSPKGRELDETIVRSLREFDAQALIKIDKKLVDQGGECGLRPIIMMMGALDGYDVKSQVFSYEGPFGVGYCVAGLYPSQYDKDRSIITKLEQNKLEEQKHIPREESPPVKLARKALEHYVRTGKVISGVGMLPAELADQRAGVFVTIKKNGRLRGCIGTIHPYYENIIQEIIHNAISAGTNDPRFNPVSKGELEKLVYSVDILKTPEPVSSLEELDVKKYGVIVRKGHRSGLLLPNLEGIDTLEEQVSIALQKAGIGEDENYSMERFEVIRYY